LKKLFQAIYLCLWHRERTVKKATEMISTVSIIYRYVRERAHVRLCEREPSLLQEKNLGVGPHHPPQYHTYCTIDEHGYHMGWNMCHQKLNLNHLYF